MKLKALYKVSAIMLTLFGFLTLFLTTSIFFNLFGVRESEGNYVLFIVIANFVSSLLYLTAAYGFWFEKVWTFKYLMLAFSVLLFSFFALIIYAINGGIHETKTIGSMAFRLIFTAVFTAISYLTILKYKKMINKKIFTLKLVFIRKLSLIFSIFIFINIATEARAQVWNLQQCIDTAQVRNKNLQISRNNMAISSQKQKEAIANLIPKFNVIGDYKYFIDLPTQLMPLSAFNPTAPEGQFKEAQFGVPHNLSASVQVAMPLYNSQIYGGISTSKIAAEFTELQYKKTEEQVYFDISNLYYNAQILQQQLIFIDSNIVNTTKLLENTQLLYRQLMIKATDVNKVELQKDQLTTQREIIANNLEQVLNALKFSMGIPTTQILEIETDIQFKESSDYSNVPTIDLQLTTMQNRLLTSELKTLKNSRLPSVSLYGSYGQTGFGYDKKPNDFLKFFPTSFVGVQLAYPLFNGTVTYRKITQKKIEIQNNELQISLVTDQNNMLVENADRRRTVAQKTIENTLSQINLATTVYEQTLLQQKEGTANLTDVLLADNTLREAQQSYLSAVVEYLKADLELKKLTGNILLKN